MIRTVETLLIQYHSPVRRGEIVNVGVIVYVNGGDPVQRWLSDEAIAERVTMLTGDAEHGEVAVMQADAVKARIAESGVARAWAWQANAVRIGGIQRSRMIDSEDAEIARACVAYLGAVP
jgi:hypothetical protein